MNMYKQAINSLKNYKSDPKHMKDFQEIINRLIIDEDNETLISIYKEAVKLYPDIRLFYFNLANFLALHSSSLEHRYNVDYYDNNLAYSELSADDIRKTADLKIEAANAFEKYLEVSKNLPEIQVEKIRDKIKRLRGSEYN